MVKKIALLLVLVSWIFPSVSALNLIPSQNQKGKWGYVDESGKKVIDFKFETALAFVDGRAKVQKGSKWGYIGTDGKEIIKIQYTDMSAWENNRSKVAVGGSNKDGEIKGAKWGYIAYDGSQLLKAEYDKISAFEDGLAYVVKGGKYGYIDESLKIVVSCDYSGIGKFNRQGYCWVAKGGKLGNGNTLIGAKYGVVDRVGKLVVKPDYKHIGTFVYDIIESNPVYAKLFNDPAMIERYKELSKEAQKGMGKKSFVAGLTNSVDEVADEMQHRSRNATDRYMGELVGAMSASELVLKDETGCWNILGYKFIDEKLFSTLDMSRSECFAVSNANIVSDPKAIWTIGLKVVDKIGILQSDGKVLLKPGLYNVAFLPSDNLIPVVKGSIKKLEANYFNVATGKLLMKKWVKTTGITDFQNGVAVIPGQEGQYLIDSNGNIISKTYDLILPQSKGVHVVKKADCYGLINGNGEEVLDTKWETILPERNGLLCARYEKDGKYGYLNSQGKFEIEPIYKYAKSFISGSAAVNNGNGWGVINTSNGIIMDFEWDDVLTLSPYNDRLCWVKKENSWRCIDLNGKVQAFEQTFQGVTNYNEHGVAVVNNELGLYGCVDVNGKMVIPTRLSTSDMVMPCLEYMKGHGMDVMTDIQARTYNLNNNPTRNGFRLSHTIDNDMWEF